jgi:hypothetical protein
MGGFVATQEGSLPRASIGLRVSSHEEDRKLSSAHGRGDTLSQLDLRVRCQVMSHERSRLTNQAWRGVVSVELALRRAPNEDKAWLLRVALSSTRRE